jgi:hypothetical protein
VRLELVPPAQISGADFIFARAIRIEARRNLCEGVAYVGHGPITG